MAFRRSACGLLVAAWLAGLAVGFRPLLEHQTSPGDPGNAADAWPDGVGVPRSRGGSTLVMAAHPRCPCTRASLRELERLIADADGRLDARVLFYRPSGTTAEWSDTDLRRMAASIPNTRALDDPGGVEIARFGARTSGHAVLYDRSGHLRFRGGITPSRGHEGPNRGRDAILERLGDGPDTPACSPTFGCPIFATERPR